MFFFADQTGFSPVTPSMVANTDISLILKT